MELEVDMNIKAFYSWEQVKAMLPVVLTHTLTGGRSLLVRFFVRLCCFTFMHLQWYIYLVHRSVILFFVRMPVVSFSHTCAI